MKSYTYTGDGAGIPGLPLHLTEEEVRALPEGLARQFQAALEAGVYVASLTSQGDAEEVVSRPQRKSKAGTPPEGE